jgi:hypothetical protein
VTSPKVLHARSNHANQNTSIDRLDRQSDIERPKQDLAIVMDELLDRRRISIVYHDHKILRSWLQSWFNHDYQLVNLHVSRQGGSRITGGSHCEGLTLHHNWRLDSLMPIEVAKVVEQMEVYDLVLGKNGHPLRRGCALAL